jgi:hypothetical protein
MAHPLHGLTLIHEGIAARIAHPPPEHACGAYVDDNEPASAMEARFTSVDVVGSVATVRLDIDNWPGHRFTEMFTPLDVNGAWQITSKVFHLHQ